MFDSSRDEKKNSTEPKSKIKYGFRGEDITYQLPDKSIELSFTWGNGNRIYTETIAKWNDGSALAEDEKIRVFNDVVRFVGSDSELPIIVINVDDPSRALWGELCSKNQELIKNIEYTSKEEQFQHERKEYLDFINAGKKITIHGVEISNEKELDEFLQNRRKNSSS